MDFPFQKELFCEKILDKTSAHYDVNVNRCDFK